MGIQVAEPDDLTEHDRSWLDAWFMERVFPVLTPLAIDPAHPFPFIPNMGLVIALLLVREEDGHAMRGLIPLPAQVDRFVRLPPDVDKAAGGTGAARFVLLEHLVGLFLHRLFPGFRVLGQGLFRLIRDTDVEFEEEAEDLVRSYESALKRRRRGVAIHLTVNAGMPPDLRELVADELDATTQEVHLVEGLIGLADVKQLIVDDRARPAVPALHAALSGAHPRFRRRLLRRDPRQGHHRPPPVREFRRCRAVPAAGRAGPDVVAIKQTLYRTSRDSPIVKALIEAAEAGKSVTAMVELRARFDEEANIRLARTLEAAGVQVVYGFTELKTHAKLSLVVRREGGTLRSYAHFGTGNYHPITARIYTDLSFFTADPELTRDAARLFNYMTGYARPERMEALAFSPLTTRSTLLELIDREIAFAEQGKPGTIWLKMNSLADDRADRRAVRGLARRREGDVQSSAASAACAPACPGCRRTSASSRSSAASWSTAASTRSATATCCPAGTRRFSSARPTGWSATWTGASRRWCRSTIRRCTRRCWTRSW